MRKVITKDSKGQSQSVTLVADSSKDKNCIVPPSPPVSKKTLPVGHLTDKEKADRKRLKKERQKEKKLARTKLVARRNESFDDVIPSATRLSTEKKITLWTSPLTALEYFLREIPCVLRDTKKRFFTFILSSVYKGTSSDNAHEVWLLRILEAVVFFALITISLAAVYFWNVKTDPMSVKVKQAVSWYFYWILLGVLSSIGFGTGLHTFILYLGPFIANVTLAAQECASVQFPKPPYPDQIICPTPELPNDHHEQVEPVSSLAILRKVSLESLSWGLGTAFGECPPYFMARAVKIAKLRRKCNYSAEDFVSGQEYSIRSKNSIITQCKLGIKWFVEKVGFWGILICASVPNPLFDLAGITCGHFLIPFMTFFWATVIGKAVIKSQLQTIFIIVAFNEMLLHRILDFIGTIPGIGPSLGRIVIDFIDHQRATFSNKQIDDSKGSFLHYILGKVVLCMVLYFVISIINGMAQSYHQRFPDLLKSQQQRNDADGNSIKKRKIRKKKDVVRDM